MDFISPRSLGDPYPRLGNLEDWSGDGGSANVRQETKKRASDTTVDLWVLLAGFESAIHRFYNFPNAFPIDQSV